MRLNILIYTYLSTFPFLFLVLIYGFVSWNKPLKFDEDDDEGEDLDTLICNVHEKRTKLDVVLKVIFD